MRIERLTVERDEARRTVRMAHEEGAKLSEQLVALEKERDHWKSNHDNRVEAARVLIERPDMPLERVEAYKKYVALQEQVAALAEQNKAFCDALAMYYKEFKLAGNLLAQPDIASGALNRIRAEGMRMAVEVCDMEDGTCGMGTVLADKLRARAAELGKAHGPISS